MVHFAAHKAVGESVQKPLEYYRNNLGGLINVAQVMQAHDVTHAGVQLVGHGLRQPAAPADHRRRAAVGDQPLRHDQADGRDSCCANSSAATRRGESPACATSTRWARTRAGASAKTRGGVPNNLMPYVSQVAVGTARYLRVFGNDYDTPDGTGVRDYIHVIDLAEGHVAALAPPAGGGASHTVNLGTGQGNSVLEVVRAFETASGRQIPYRVAGAPPGRRGGVLRRSVAGAAPARLARPPGLSDMCAHAWALAARQSARFFELTFTQRSGSKMTIQLQPVIMAGGSGTRLWPLSRSGFPKQFLALDGTLQPVSAGGAAAGRAGRRTASRRPRRWWWATTSIVSCCSNNCAS